MCFTFYKCQNALGSTFLYPGHVYGQGMLTIVTHHVLKNSVLKDTVMKV